MNDMSNINTKSNIHIVDSLQSELMLIPKALYLFYYYYLCSSSYLPLTFQHACVKTFLKIYNYNNLFEQ